ncbi:hypothetical protein AA313_de0207162 [Arthrobotrys entomopaga]|nr:hypothetical protein AA313_de0207162 [Arthrobotrys entomopaga]
MCFEYIYSDCGVHPYRVSLIPPDLCRCAREIEKVDYDCICDICNLPGQDVAQPLAAKNLTNVHQTPEDDDEIIENEEKTEQKKPTWVIDVRGILKGHPKPEEVQVEEKAEDEEEEWEDEDDTGTNVSTPKKRKCQWIIDVRGKLKGHPKEPKKIITQATNFRSDGNQSEFKKEDIKPSREEHPEAEKKNKGQGKKEPKWDIDRSGQPKERDESEGGFKKDKPSKGLWKDYY